MNYPLKVGMKLIYRYANIKYKIIDITESKIHVLVNDEPSPKIWTNDAFSDVPFHYDTRLVMPLKKTCFTP